MIRRTRLAPLPPGIRFPEELQSKISYDPERQQLQYDGFMSKTDFDKLIRLHNDLAYQRALEQLFQLCVFTAPPPPLARARWPWVFTGLAAAMGITAFVMLLRRF